MERRNSDRWTASSVRAEMDRLFSNPYAGQTCLNLLADSIAHLNEVANERWSITIHPGMVRLNTGRVEALSFHPQEIGLLVDARDVEADEVEDGTLPIYLQGDLKHAPECRQALFSPDDAPEVVPQLWEAHLSALEIATAIKLPPAVLQLHAAGVVEFLREEARADLRQPGYASDPVEVSDVNFYPELLDSPVAHEIGAVMKIPVNRYERDPDARAACLAYHGAACSVCRMTYRRVYDGVAPGFMHVHHVVSIESLGRGYIFDPIRDLRPICPNCHALVHMTEPPITLIEAIGRVRRTDEGGNSRR